MTTQSELLNFFFQRFLHCDLICHFVFIAFIDLNFRKLQLEFNCRSVSFLLSFMIFIHCL